VFYVPDDSSEPVLRARVYHLPIELVRISKELLGAVEIPFSRIPQLMAAAGREPLTLNGKPTGAVLQLSVSARLRSSPRLRQLTSQIMQARVSAMRMTDERRGLDVLGLSVALKHAAVRHPQPAVAVTRSESFLPADARLSEALDLAGLPGKDRAPISGEDGERTAASSPGPERIAAEAEDAGGPGADSVVGRSLSEALRPAVSESARFVVSAAAEPPGGPAHAPSVLAVDTSTPQQRAAVPSSQPSPLSPRHGAGAEDATPARVKTAVDAARRDGAPAGARTRRTTFAEPAPELPSTPAPTLASAVAQPPQPAAASTNLTTPRPRLPTAPSIEISDSLSRGAEVGTLSPSATVPLVGRVHARTHAAVRR
jgi:hypothetical protein